MKYWFDAAENTIILNENGIVLGTSDKEHHDKISTQLTNGTNPLEVFGTEDLSTIPFTQIQSLLSRSTDEDIEVKFRQQKEIESKGFSFENIEERDQFLTEVNSHLSSHLEKTVKQQGVLSAILPSLLSTIIGALVVYLFWNKFRTVTMVLGGLWVLGSLYSLFKRLTNPPEITRWAVKGKHLRKTWHGIKLVGSTAFSALLVFLFSLSIPNIHGEMSLYEEILKHGETAEVSVIDKYLERGADINFVDDGKELYVRDGALGQTPLLMSLYWENDELSKALIEKGADVSYTSEESDSSVLETAIAYDAGQDVLKMILDRLDIDKMIINGSSLTEQIQYLEESEDAEDAELIALLKTYVK